VAITPKLGTAGMGCFTLEIKLGAKGKILTVDGIQQGTLDIYVLK
jgi:hypothetical protein